MMQEVALGSKYEIHIGEAHGIAIGNGATVINNGGTFAGGGSPLPGERARGPEGGVARLWAEDLPVGMGTLVKGGDVVTVAHVVARAWGVEKTLPAEPRQAPVRMDFPLAAPQHWVEGRVVGWWPDDDLALLRVESCPPEATPLPLLEREEPLGGHPFRAYGCPLGRPGGIWSEGKVMGLTADGLQLDGLRERTGYGVQGGFSGGPLWDDERGCCVGIIRSGMESRRVAFAIPAWVVSERLGLREASPVLAPNPFGETRPIRDEARFIGRRAEMERLFRLLERGSVVVEGKPKIGKTSFLHRAAARWEAGGGRVLGFVDVQELEGMEELVAELCALLGCGRADRYTLRKRLKEARGLLLIDEMDTGPRHHLTVREFEMMRAALSANPHLHLLVATRIPLRRVFPDDGNGSPFYNYLQPLELGPFSEAEARALLAHPWADEAARFDEATVATLLRLAGGHPFRLQRAAYHRYEALRDPAWDWLARYRRDEEAML